MRRYACLLALLVLGGRPGLAFPISPANDPDLCWAAVEGIGRGVALQHGGTPLLDGLRAFDAGGHDPHEAPGVVTVEREYMAMAYRLAPGLDFRTVYDRLARLECKPLPERP